MAEQKPPKEGDVLLSDEEFARALSGLSFLKGWCRSVERKAVADMTSGRAVPGWKLVRGRAGPRKWRKGLEANLAKVLTRSLRLRSSDVYAPKVLKSPAQLEKLLKEERPDKWQELETEYIDQAPGRLTPAPESDKRPAASGAEIDLEELAE